MNFHEPLETLKSCSPSDSPLLADSGFFKYFFNQDGLKSTVSWIFEDLDFKISKGYDQNWSEPSEILNLRSSTTPETVAFTPPRYQTW